MKEKTFEMLKSINPRIRKYERKQKDADDQNIKVVTEFSCSAENKKILEKFIRNVQKSNEDAAEILEILNETIYFRVVSNIDFSEKLFEEIF